MGTYTVDLFRTLDGFGSRPVGYWGKGGPELQERQARVFFGGEQETLVLGAGTYRLMAGFAAERGHDPAVSELAGNALEDAKTGFDLRLQVRQDRAVRVEVLDHGPGSPDLRAPDTTSERGHGEPPVAAEAQRRAQQPPNLDDVVNYDDAHQLSPTAVVHRLEQG